MISFYKAHGLGKLAVCLNPSISSVWPADSRGVSMQVCWQNKNPPEVSLVCSQTPSKEPNTHYPALIMQWIWLWLKFTSKSLIIMSQVRGFYGDFLLWRSVELAHIHLDEKSYPLLIHKDISGLQVFNLLWSVRVKSLSTAQQEHKPSIFTVHVCFNLHLNYAKNHWRLSCITITIPHTWTTMTYFAEVTTEETFRNNTFKT